MVGLDLVLLHLELAVAAVGLEQGIEAADQRRGQARAGDDDERRRPLRAGGAAAGGAGGEHQWGLPKASTS